ncbi:hypothetical protein VHUM_03866 [Vanrija humicola]|uniref:ABC1 atypical kinase-like domain-containing protein n=1 Tax=Vanrija humicola TaxID=5417 RepID=A0A7D8Z324_VANHU|nr:hypothetical protein VHUM_03866 [Vanrija humicola]
MRRHRALAAVARQLTRRANHTSSQPPAPPAGAALSQDRQPTPAAPQEPITGAAKLFLDAIEEESNKADSSRAHLIHTQGPIWTGEESTHDAVLRMLVDAYKPLRTGEGVKHDASEKRIHDWMKNYNPELPVPSGQPQPPPSLSDFLASSEASPHRTTIPPHLHRPWHATYTGDNQVFDGPKVKYGDIENKRTDPDALENLMELKLPLDPNGTQKAKARNTQRKIKLQGRLGRAREGALDYRLGISDGDLTDIGVENEEVEKFSGNRQLRGSSALGAARGGASGMKAWAGLVEDRIQRAQSTGFFDNVKGRGEAVRYDPEMKNPHLEMGEVFMNRIVKRQGALPPWIEIQQIVDADIRGFRTLLLETYTRHLVRDILSKNSIDLLPPLRAIPGRDEVWEAQNSKFHEENVKQINNQLRRMNAQAPSPSRRSLMMLEHELNRIRGDVLRDNVWKELHEKVDEIRVMEARRPVRRNSKLLDAFNNVNNGGSNFVQGLGASAGSSSGGWGQGPDAAMPHHNSNAGGGMGFLVFTGVGLGAVVYYKTQEPTRNDAPEPEPVVELIPVHEEEEDVQERFVASSMSEAHFSPIHFISTYIIEPFLTVVRFLHLALLFGPVILTSPMLLVGSTKRRRAGPTSVPEDNWGAVWWYGFLVAQMERAGPSFIKLGQWAASRTDLFPAALCDKMSKLHSSNNPHPFRHTQKVIETAFGLSLDDIFEEFERTPIGCGAIAQVYRAKLRPEIVTNTRSEAEQLVEEMELQSGDRRIVTEVAIKVLHPRVRRLVRRDIAIMSVFANIINAFPGMEWISLPEEVQVFGEMMNQQLDLRVEASNLEKFIANFRDRGNSVTFPQPINLGRNGTERAKKARRDVLIEQYEDALPLKYFLKNGGGPYDEKIANIGLDAFLEMLLLDNWTHGDLHPGNIMVRFVLPGSTDLFQPLLRKFQRAPEVVPPIPTESISETELVHELRAIADDKDKWLDRLEELESEGYTPQLVFIDAGLVTSLDATNRQNFLDLFQAVAEFDGYKTGMLMVDRCRHPELAIDVETFALKMQHLILSIKSKTFSLAKIKISDILTDVLSAVRTHHVKLEGDFVNTVISILLLEGIGRQLDPDMDLFKSALPILRQVGRQMSTREAMSTVGTGNIWAMLKLWVWAEARSVAGEGRALDQWIKVGCCGGCNADSAQYDYLSPNI